MDTSELQKIKQRYNIVGNSDGLNHALDVALQVAPTDLSVLIIGESGVGKEIIPRVIHDNSPRRREKYFAINCGSIPEGTIDSELFGHEKGSFTGAIGESEGYFGIANKGTIFLDEVGELPIQTQARLLRVLETGEYIRVGGTEIRKTDVRIVAATNVNMRKAVSEGRFREDLYYRLNTIPIQMPALRERGDDILLLFRLFAMQMAEKYRLPKISLSDEAMLSLFCIGDAVAKDAKFETGVSFGSTGADEPYSSLTDKDGNYYISGMCRGDVEFAGGATIKGRGGMDAVIVKYDAELNFLWARAVGGSKDDTFERIAVTSAGDIVAVGKISGDVTIDGTDQTLSGTQSTDGCIVVYDKDGNYKSSAQIKAAGASLCYSVAVDKSDNIFVRPRCVKPSGQQIFFVI